MDKIDLCIITLIYLFWLTLTILTVATFFLANPYAIGREPNNGLPWNNKFSLHMIIFVLSGLHSLVQIPIIKLPPNMDQEIFTVHIFLYWLKFYFGLVKHKRNRRSI